MKALDSNLVSKCLIQLGKFFSISSRPAVVFLLALQLSLGGALLTSCKKAIRAKGTSNAANGFQGLKSFKPRPDGTWLLEWDPIPELNLSYEVFMREEQGQSSNAQSISSFDFSNPVGRTTEGYFITDVLSLKMSKCFLVRVTHSSYVDNNTKEFCTGATPATSSISKVTSPPVFTQLSLVNGALDGKLNEEEVAADLQVVSLEGSGFDTAQFAIVSSSAACDASHAYAAGLPTSADVGETDDTSNKICVKLTNAFGESVYGSSEPIVVDLIAPAAATPVLANLSSDGKLNANMFAANLPLVTFSAEEGESAAYAVAESAPLCTSALSYVAEIPTTSHAAFSSGSSRVVCVQVTDSAGNVAYSSSPVITTDTLAPLNALAGASALNDGVINMSENSVTGFPVEIKGEPLATYKVTCTTNCILVSGGTISLSGASTSGSLSATGVATVYIKATASGTFTFETLLSDNFGNANPPSSTTGTAALTAPAAPAMTMTSLLASPVSIDENGTPLPVVLSGVANSTYVFVCTSNCVVISGGVGSLNSSGQASPTIQILADGTFELSSTITDPVGNSSTGTLSGTADLTAPGVTIGAPSPNSVTSADSSTLEISITDADVVNITSTDVILNSASGIDCTKSLTGSSLTSRTLTLSACSGAGTVSVSLMAGVATDAAGNVSAAVGPSANLAVNVGSGPLFTGLILIHGAVDGKINSTEWSADESLVALDASGFDTATYGLIDSTSDPIVDLATCGSNSTSYSVGTPTAQDLPDASSKRVCVKVAKSTGAETFGVSGVIVTDKTLPLDPVVSLANGASDGTLLASEISANPNDAVVSVTPGAGETASYVISSNAADCANVGSALVYDTTIPIASRAEFQHATTKYVCVRFTDAAGNVSNGVASAGITTNAPTGGIIPPTFTSFDLINGASDGKLNAAEVTTNLVVGALNASGFSSATYALIDSTTAAVAADIMQACQDESSYLAGVPLAGAVGAVDGSSKRVCVRLENNAGILTYGYSDLIEVDKTPPTLASPPALSLANDALNGELNSTEVGADQNVVSFVPDAGESVSFAVAESSAQCTGSLTYVSDVPKAGHSGFASGTTKVVCAQVSDSAGNVSYGWSAAISTDTQAPLAPFVTLSALSDLFVNATENSGGGFAVAINGEAGGSYSLVCITNCSVASGTGSFSSGAAAVQVVATASGPFSFEVELTDSFGNTSSKTTQTGNADLAAPSLAVVDPFAPPANVTSSQTVMYTLNFSDVGGSSVSSISFSSSDIQFSGASAGCVATVGTPSATSRTVSITGCSAASGTLTLTMNLLSGAVVDGAGNESVAVSPSRSFTVSNGPPHLTITSPAASAVKSGASFNVQGECVTGLTVVLASVDLTPVASSGVCTSGLYSISVQLAGGDGSKNILATSQDAAGQVGSAAIVVVKESTPPTVTISAPSALHAKSSSSAITYDVSFSDASGVSSVSASPVITEVKTSTADCDVTVPTISGTGPYQLSINNCTGNGTFTVTVGAGAATDTAGNLSSATTASTAIIVDNIIPATPTISGSIDGVTITSNPSATALTGGCAEAGSTITLVGDVASGQTTTCSGGTPSYSFSSWTLAVGNGSKTVTVTETDPAGNVSSQSSSVSVNLNASPLAATLTPATVSGLKPTLTGTCDHTANSHTAIATGVAQVRDISCSGSGVLSVVVHLPAGAASTFTVTVSSTNVNGTSSSSAVTFNRNAFTCPAGYVGVPGSGIAGLGNASAVAGHSDWTLDVSRDFCVMKYPAKENVSPSKAISTEADSPWVSINRDQANTECGNNGDSVNYRLMSNTQWQTVARNAESVAFNWSGGVVGSAGGMFQGHTDNSPSNSLASSDSDPYFETLNSAVSGPEQRRTKELSNGEVVWDFGGNVWHWVHDSYGGLGVNGSLSGSNEFNTITNSVNRLLFAPSGAYNSTHKIGRLIGGSAAVARGGDWNGGADAGLFAVNLLNFDGNSPETKVGFRCAFNP